MTAPSPDPNGNSGSGDSGIGGLLDSAGNAISGVAGSLGSSIGSAIQSLATAIIKPVVDEIEAKSLNTLNQILNTAWYGFLAVFGGIVMAVGVYMLAEKTGATGNVSSLLLPVAKLARYLI
jgi:hypothetical protein